MGVFRSVERPVYDELMAEQIEVAKAKGEGELAALLGSGDTRTVAARGLLSAPREAVTG